VAVKSGFVKRKKKLSAFSYQLSAYAGANRHQLSFLSEQLAESPASVFHQQFITTAAQVLSLYWEGFIQDLDFHRFRG